MGSMADETVSTVGPTVLQLSGFHPSTNRSLAVRALGVSSKMTLWDSRNSVSVARSEEGSPGRTNETMRSPGVPYRTAGESAQIGHEIANRANVRIATVFTASLVHEAHRSNGDGWNSVAARRELTLGEPRDVSLGRLELHKRRS